MPQKGYFWSHVRTPGLILELSDTAISAEVRETGVSLLVSFLCDNDGAIQAMPRLLRETPRSIRPYPLSAANIRPWVANKLNYHDFIYNYVYICWIVLWPAGWCPNSSLASGK